MGAAAYGERAKAFAKAGRFKEAEAALRAGLAHLPGQPVLSYALGILLLARGAYEEGWKLYEYRWAVPQGPPRLNLPFPRWRGEAVKSLVLLPEQGLGDQIMFARYVPMLVGRGVAVTLACPTALHRLFLSLGAEVIASDGPTSLPKRDAWAYVGSLPGILGIPSAPYLPSSSRGAGIGVMLEGKTQGRLPEPAYSTLARLGRDLGPLSTGASDFEDTAEIIRGLERVVTVDTAVAHLAGAMGKPTWLLLPKSPDWRWGRSGETTPWYPSMRLVRNGDYETLASTMMATPDAPLPALL